MPGGDQPAARAAGLIGNIGTYEPKSMDWATYKGRLEFYFTANGITDAVLQRASLLTLIGETGYRMLADLHFPNELKTIGYDVLIADLDKAYGRNVSKLASRIRFQTLSQHEGQTIDEFIAELRHGSMDCGFGDTLENRLKDQFIAGIRSDHFRKKLLEDEDRSLEDILKKACTLELIDRENGATANKADVHLAAAWQSVDKTHQQRQFNHKSSESGLSRSSESNWTGACTRCGASNHKPEDCFYLIRKLQCRNCNRIGHKANMCNSRRNMLKTSSELKDQLSSKPPLSKAHYTETDDTGDTVMTVHAIENVPPIFYTVEVNNVAIKMEVDSGSGYSLLSSTQWERLGKPILRKGPELKDVNRQPVPVLGMAYVDVYFQGKTKRLRVVFLQSPDSASLLGREWIAEFGISLNKLKQQLGVYQAIGTSAVEQNVQSLLSEFSDLFDSSCLTPIKGFKAHLHVKANAEYKLNKPRSLPYSIRPKVEAEFIRLEQLGIIEKVNTAEFSTTPIVPVLKSNGQVRLWGLQNHPKQKSRFNSIPTTPHRRNFRATCRRISIFKTGPSGCIFTS